MELKRYRFNRKVGKIYLESPESPTGLKEVGSEMQAIILWASEPAFGKPFAHLPAQDWIQLCLLDRQGDWCYALLNSGSTNSLWPWIQYRQGIERACLETYEIVTTIGFESADSENQWFDYKFSGVLGKIGLRDRMQSLIGSTKLSVVDIDLNLPI